MTYRGMDEMKEHELVWVDGLIEQRDRLVRLVMWMARTYGYEDPDTGEMTYNLPTFVDHRGVVSPEKQELLDTFTTVVRDKATGEPGEATGEVPPIEQEARQ